MVETPTGNGQIARLSKDVNWMQAEPGVVETRALTETALQPLVRAKNVTDAPVGTVRRTAKSSDGRSLTLEMTRIVAGAPFARVEVRDGDKTLSVTESEWALKGDAYVLLGRRYERVAADGRVIRSSVVFRDDAKRAQSSWMLSLNSESAIEKAMTPGASELARFPRSSVEDDGCGDGGGVIRSAGVAQAVMCEGGCTLKFLAMTGAGVAASVLGGAGAFGFIATLASGGTLLPAQLAVVGAYLIAEAEFLSKTDAWLDCINK